MAGAGESLTCVSVVSRDRTKVAWFFLSFTWGKDQKVTTRRMSRWEKKRNSTIDRGRVRVKKGPPRSISRRREITESKGRMGGGPFLFVYSPFFQFGRQRRRFWSFFSQRAPLLFSKAGEKKGRERLDSFCGLTAMSPVRRPTEPGTRWRLEHIEDVIARPCVGDRFVRFRPFLRSQGSEMGSFIQGSRCCTGFLRDPLFRSSRARLSLFFFFFFWVIESVADLGPLLLSILLVSYTLIQPFYTLFSFFRNTAGTPYAGGYFRVRFDFADTDFPHSPPKCEFFHPLENTSPEQEARAYATLASKKIAVGADAFLLFPLCGQPWMVADY